MTWFRKMFCLVLVMALLLNCVALAVGYDSNDNATAEEAPITRADIENAAVETAWAYYMKGDRIQYDSELLTPLLDKYLGGSYRITERVAPEYGTEDTTIFSVCSDFCHKVWENIGISVMGHPLNAVTNNCWLYGESAGVLAARWWNSSYSLSSLDTASGIDEDSPYNMTTSEIRLFLSNQLRPGDWIVCTGHALLYVGNGYVIDCAGQKYDMDSGLDAVEPDGSLDYLHTIENLFLNGTDPKLGSTYQIVDGGSVNHCTIIRPTQLLCQDDGDGDLSDDIASDYSLPAWTQSRLAYPALNINRTVDRGPFGTVPSGGNLTYSVEIRNQSNDADYVMWRQATDETYAGSNYQELVVTETIPANTQLLENTVSHNGVVQGDTITWTVNIPAGSSVSLSYTVCATGSNGTVIYSSGGFVDDIPSNTIANAIGGQKLSATALNGLNQFHATDPSSWYETYNVCGATNELDFAERVYAKAMGLQLDLPTAQEMFALSFQQIHLEAGTQGLGSLPTDIWMYQLKNDNQISAENADAFNMIVDGFVGGKSVYFENSETCIKEIRTDYLEPGDVLLYMTLTDYPYSDAVRTVQSVQTIIYVGDGKIVYADTDGVLRRADGVTAETILEKGFIYDVLLVLRPTQSFENLNSSDYVGPEPDYSDWIADNPYVDGSVFTPGVSLSAENQEKIADLSTNGWKSGQRNLKFAYYAYQKIGLDLYDLNVSLISGFMDQICTITTENEIRKYTIKPEAAIPTDSLNLYRMIVPGYLGGENLIHSEIPTIEHTLSDLQVGDVVALGDYETSHYTVGLYQGEGNFLVSEYQGKANPIVETWTESTFTDTNAYVEWLENDAYGYWFVFRPSRAFADINTCILPDCPTILGTTLLSETNVQKLQSIKADSLTQHYLGFAAEVYSKIDKRISLSDAITSNMTVSTAVNKFATSTASSLRIDDTIPAGGSARLYNMLVPGLYGGSALQTKGGLVPKTDGATWSLSMLHVGDILLMANRYDGTTYTWRPYQVAVYQGNGKFLVYYTSGASGSTPVYSIYTISSDSELGTFITTDYRDENASWAWYLVLRPSQAYYEINNTGLMPACPETIGTSELNEKNVAKLQSMSASSLSKYYLGVALEVYSQIDPNIDLSDAITDNMSVSSATSKIGTNVASGLRISDTMPTNGSERLYNMLVPGMYGGSALQVTGNATPKTDGATWSLDDLDPGDILLMANRYNEGTYSWKPYQTAVYQGNGSFLVFYTSGISGSTPSYTEKEINSDETFRIFVTKDENDGNASWAWYLVLRPARAYYDINNTSLTPTT